MVSGGTADNSPVCEPLISSQQDLPGFGRRRSRVGENFPLLRDEGFAVLADKQEGDLRFGRMSAEAAPSPAAGPAVIGAFLIDLPVLAQKKEEGQADGQDGQNGDQNGVR